MKKVVKSLSKPKSMPRNHPCVDLHHCPSCKARTGEMCKPYMQKKGRPRGGIVRYPHIARLSKYEQELPRG